MNYTTYEITEGPLRDSLVAIFDAKDRKMVERQEYAASIGALENGVVCCGTDVDGFLFENPEDKPDRWVWQGKVQVDGKSVEYARRKRLSNADKEEWKKIDALKDRTSASLNKLFYEDSWGFSAGNAFGKRHGVGGFCTGNRAFAEVATEAAVLPGMKEILRSEYIAMDAIWRNQS